MLSIGLTGNRMSGKNLVMSAFKQVGIPIFDADLVLKYLLNYRPDITMSVLGTMGEEYLFQGNYIDLNKFDDDVKFNELLDLVDFEINEAYDNFKRRHIGAQYTIFKCSWIFERGIKSRFDLVVNVFTPREERILRYRGEKGVSLTEANKIFKNELTDIHKNTSSNYVIHAYDCGLCILDQVNNIDKKIIDDYILCKENRKEVQHD